MRKSRLMFALALVATARTGAQNLILNGDFNSGSSGWILRFGANAQWETGDVDECLTSGSWRADSETVGLQKVITQTYCFEVPHPGTLTVLAHYRQTFVSFGNVGIVLDFYEFDGCTGLIESSATFGFPPSTSWASASHSAAVPANAVSAVTEVWRSSESAFSSDLDRVSVTYADPIFLDPFEVQGTCRWSDRAGLESGCTAHTECDIPGECCFVNPNPPGVCVPGTVIAGVCLLNSDSGHFRADVFPWFYR